MAVKIQSTKDVGADGVKCCVYGSSGIGKTCLLATAPKPIILSCESGLLSLKDLDIPYIEINTVQDVYDAYEELTTTELGDAYETICLDSISEIAEVVLIDFKKTIADPRKSYPKMSDDMAEMIRSFRDIKGKNVVFTAKRNRVQNDDGITMELASMPGKTLVNGLPYFFDEVLFMTLMQGEDGDEYRVLKTRTGFGHDAKDRSGKLNEIEQPDLTKIFNKIRGIE